MPTTHTRSFNAKRARAALLAALRREVAELVRQEHADALIETLDLTDYQYDGPDFTCSQIGHAIAALAPLLTSVDKLADVVHTAAYYRHLGKRDDRFRDTPHESMMRDLARHRAEATLDRAGAGVLGRYLFRAHEDGAKFEAELVAEQAARAEVH